MITFKKPCEVTVVESDEPDQGPEYEVAIVLQVTGDDSLRRLMEFFPNANPGARH